MIHVVGVARELGVYSIVTDMSPTSPAKRHADKAYDISTADLDQLEQLARDERIDGVFTAYDDFNTGIAVELCQRLGLPFYATAEQIEITKDKQSFKALCQEHGVPVVDEYTEDALDSVVYPVIVKPADSYGSKGISVCLDRPQLEKGIEVAKSFSKTSNVMIERFMTCHGLNIDYVIQDGKVILTAVGDRYTNDKQVGLAPLSCALVFPSMYTRRYMDELDEKVRLMFQRLGLRNGVLFIQAFVDEEGFYLYEMGFRAGGGQTSILVAHMTGVDYVKLLINFALTGSMSNDDLSVRSEPEFGRFACGLTYLARPGTIHEVVGLDEIRNLPDVVNITQYYYPGDTVQSTVAGTLSQTFAKIHVVTSNCVDLIDTIDATKQKLRVRDKDGKMMLLDGFDTNLLSPENCASERGPSIIC